MLKNTQIKSIFLSFFIALSLVVVGFGLTQTVSAATPESNLCKGANLSLSSGGCGSEGANSDKLNKLLGSIINIFTIVVAIVAVVMVIIGGFKLITSGGDSGKVASGRNTVIYAIVGLVIVALAQIIVRFILTRI